MTSQGAVAPEDDLGMTPATTEPPRAGGSSSQSSLLTSIDRTKFAVAVVGAVAAIVPPTTTYISKSFELDMAKAEQAQRLRLQAAEQEHRLQQQHGEQQQKFLKDFLEWVLKPEFSGDTYFRRDVLSFFASALEDGRVKIWAKEELKRAAAEIDQLKQLREDVRVRETHIAALETEVSEAKQSALRYERQGARSREQNDAAQHELEQKQAELNQARVAADASAARAEEMEASINRHNRINNPCPKGFSFTTGAADQARGLAACAFEAPRSPGIKVWRVKLEGETISCGCQPG